MVYSGVTNVCINAKVNELSEKNEWFAGLDSIQRMNTTIGRDKRTQNDVQTLSHIGYGVGAVLFW